ncbi:MAG: OmpA family protein [Verrucomicrobiota bacterium]|jgi:peptidoglycan-associated lipoprotein
MKMMKLTYLLAFALAFTLADTGCRNHRPVKVTPIPGSPSGQVGELGPGGTMAPGGQIQIGGGPTVNREEFENMDADRAALAAYTVHFAYDSAAVRKSEKANVQAVADALGRDASTKLLIEGHCDERGTEEYNRSLGERRALALRQALAKIGVDPSRIRTISYGKDKPADPGHDESAWLKNRRGEFVLLHPKSGS